MNKRLLTLAMALFIVGAAFSKTIYVNDNATGNNDGTSWEDAYTNFSEAIESAQSGDELWVAAGIYYPTSQPNYPVGSSDPKFNHFTLKNGVKILGGFAGDETSIAQRDLTANKSVLSGDIDKNDDVEGEGYVSDYTKVNGKNSLKLFYFPEGSTIDTTAVLDGFVLTAAVAGNDVSPYNSGAAFYCKGASPKIVNCDFYGNYAKYYAGAIFLDNSSMVLENCNFEGNKAEAHAGAFYYENSEVSLRNCDFINNRARYGGALSASNNESVSEFENCTFENNSAWNNAGVLTTVTSPNVFKNCSFINNEAPWGGALVLYTESSSEIINCIFEGNRTVPSAHPDVGEHGGAIYAAYKSKVNIYNSAFRGNEAYVNGGAIFSLDTADIKAYNTLFTGNVNGETMATSSSGSAIYSDSSKVTLVNSTIASNYSYHNYSDQYGAAVNNRGADLIIRNCIIWENHGKYQIRSANGVEDVTNSNVQGGFTGSGNMDVIPLFLDPVTTSSTPSTGGNYRLWGNSPVNNKGVNTALPEDIHDLDNDGDTEEPLPYDLNGKERVFAGVVDMGCYEQQFETVSGNQLSIWSDESSGQYVDMGDNLTLDGTDFTIELWLKPRTDALNDSHHNICGNDDNWDVNNGGAANRPPMLYIFQYDRIHYGYGDGTGWYEDDTEKALKIGQWNHIAITFDDATNTLKAYANGKLLDSLTGGGEVTSTPLKYINKDQELRAYLDEFRVWKEERTQAELIANMNSTLSGNEDNLALYYSFDQVTSGEIEDQAGINNGTMKNGPGIFNSDAILTPVLKPVENVGIDNFKISWHPVPDAFDYYIDVATDPEFKNLVRFGMPTNGDTSYTVNGLSRGTVYYYKVTVRTNNDDWGRQYGHTATKLTPPGNAFAFDGSTYIDATDVTKYEFSGTTIETWVKVDADQLNSKWALWACNPSDYKNNYVLFYNDYGNGYQFNLGQFDYSANSYTDDRFSGTTLSADTWYHIAVVIDTANNNGTFYLNGEFKGNFTPLDGPYPYGSYFSIGQEFDDGAVASDHIKGSIDEFRIWSKALSQSEIQDNMNVTLNGNEEGLVTYYNFDLQTGKKVIDNSNIFDGEVVGTADWVASTAGLQDFTAEPSAQTTEGFTITWEAVDGAADYMVDVATDAQFANQVISADSTSGDTTYNASGLTQGTKYYFRVTTDQGDTSKVNYITTLMEVPGNALVFDGKDDYVDISQVGDLGQRYNSTMECWVYMDPTETYARFISINTESGGNKYLLSYQSGKGYTVYNQKAGTHMASQIHTKGAWVHLAVAFDNDIARFYLNGDLISEVTGGYNRAIYPGNLISLGQEYDGENTSDFLKGAMDEVRFWDRTLTQSEIRANMHKKLSGDEAGLFAYYDFDQNQGQFVYDKVNGLDGTIIGDPQWNSSDAIITPLVSSVDEVTPSGITLSWNAIDDATDYKLEVATNQGFQNIEQTISSTSNDTTYEITGLSEDTQYFIRVASQTNRWSAWSASQKISTLLIPPGNALAFDGVDGEVNVGYVMDSDWDNITLEAWAKIATEQTNNYPRIIGNYDGNAGFGLNLWKGTRQLYFEFRDATDSSWDTIMSPSSIADNIWHHIACTYDGTDMKLYMDGELISSKNNPGAAIKQQAIKTGIGNQNGDAPLNGTLDEIRIWNTARTQEELKEYAHKTLTGSESGLVSCFNLDKAEGNTFKDGAGNHDGTMTGGVSWAESKALITPFATGAADTLNNGFTATWDSIPNASKYYLRVATDPLLTEPVEGWESVDVGSDTAYSVTGLQENTMYYYGTMSETDRLSAWSPGSDAITTTGGTTGELAANLHGTGNYIDLSEHIARFAGKNAGAIKGWFKATEAGTILKMTGATAGDNVQLIVGDFYGGYEDESLWFICSTDGDYDPSFGVREGHNKYLDNNWHHFAVIMGDGNNRFVIDGHEKEVFFHNGTSQSQEFTNITGPDSLYVGKGMSLMVDELAFYKNPITNNEVVERAHQKLTGNEVGLVAYYNFDNSSAYDASGMGRNGTETGNVSYISANLLPTPFLEEPLPGVTVADLSWSAIDSASHYMVEVATDANFQNKVVSNEITTETSYHVEGLDKNTKYFYRAKSKVDSLWSEFSGRGEFFTLPGNSLVLDGVNQYVMADGISDYASDEATIECWVKSEYKDSKVGIWAHNRKSDGTNQYVLMYRPYNQTLEVATMDGAGFTGYATGDVNLMGSWHHVAVSIVKDGISAVYIDGKNVLEFTHHLQPIVEGFQFSIGQEYDTDVASDFFGGEIDEFRVWNKALTEAEIRANMNLSEPEGASEHYIAHFSFDEMHEGNIFKDLAKQNDATLVNGPTIKASEGVINPITLEPSDITLGSFVMHLNDIASAQSYEVEVAYDETFVPPLAIHENIGKTSSYKAEGLCPGVKYFYRVRAIYDENTISDWSAPDTVWTINQDAIIENLSSTQGDYSGELKLSWECKNEYLITEFEIKRSPAGEGDYEILDTLENTHGVYNYTDTKAKPGTYYEYTVQGLSYCYGNDTETDTTNIGYGLPTITAGKNDGRIQLDWEYADNFAQNLEIVRKDVESGIEQVFQEVADSTRYFDTTMSLCIPYQYKLVSKTADFGDVTSKPVVYTLREDITDAIDTLDASKGYKDGKITLNWLSHKQSIIDEYQISRRLYCSGNDFEVAKIIDRGETQVWIDEDASPGMYYEYCIIGLGTCGNNTLFTDSVFSVGFRQPEGIMSGLITYKGGNPVEDVKVIADYANADETLGSCLHFDGSDKMILREGKTFDFSNGFTWEMWVRPADLSNDFTLLENLDSTIVSIYYNAAGNSIGANVDTADVSYELSGELWENNSWNHVAVKADGSELSILINGEEAGSAPCDVLPAITGSSDMCLNYNGYIDEMRLWNIALTDSLISRNHQLVLSRESDGLAAALRFDVNKGSYAFDHSRTQDVANEAHGFIYGAEWSQENIPSKAKLALAALSEPAGSYMIKGVWFAGNGDNYSVTPIYGVHAFEPASRDLLVSENSLVFSNQDYTDISSFEVKGNVKYKNTTFPVTGVNILIDGEKKYDIENNPIQTGDQGNFTIEVPIGEHVLSVQKEGHVFAERFFPPKENGEIVLHNFQDDITGLQFIDSTTRIIAGRVVGGSKEAGKKIGFGKSVNNIGQYEIILKAEREAFGYKDTVMTNDTSGEYEMEVIPERFIVESVEGNPAYLFDLDMEGVIDLTDKNEFEVVRDTQIIDNGEAPADTLVDEYAYHYKKNWVYRTPMSIYVTKPNGNPVICDSLLQLESGDVPIYAVDGDGNVTYHYGQPVFAESKNRRLKIEVTEEYTNNQTGMTYTSPVTDAKVIVNNNLAMDDTQKEISVNDEGVAWYSFWKGKPNLTEDPNYPELSFTKTLEVKAERTGETVSWEPPYAADGTYRGINLGFQVTGTNFVTRGPDKVNFVLRDPPGSNSSAFVEKGFTLQRSTTTSRNRGYDASLGMSMTAGNVTVGATASHSSSRSINNTNTETISFNTKYSTSDAADYVGAKGDVFFGASTNITYGLCKQLSILPVDSCHPDLPSANDEYQGHKIGQMFNFAMGDEVNTTFVYTQNHIDNYLIPDLMKLRNNFFVNNPGIYDLTDASRKDEIVPDPGYYNYHGGHGVDSVMLYQRMINSWVMELAINEIEKMIADGDLNDNASIAGQLGDWELGSAWEENQNGTKVVHLRIGSGKALATAAIKRVERSSAMDKKFYDKNISFDAGANYESSMSTSQETSVERSYEFQTSVGFHTEVETPSVKIPFVGSTPSFKFEASASINTGGSSSSSETESEDRTVGYTLSDGDQGDFFSVDVVKDAYGNGPVFITRGGQSACPYEGQTETKYVVPGTPIGSATMKIEVPTLQVEESMVANVPETNPAVYTLKLGNQSEVDADSWFILEVDVASNPDGAKIKMDGASINNGTAILIPGGKQITKTIELHKGKADVNEYSDIRLVLHSMCQYDPTSDGADIYDDVTISAHFIPTCTPVALTQPSENWLLNIHNNDTLPIRISGYNTQLSTFDKLALQYKPKAESNWVTMHNFFNNQEAYDEHEGDDKELIENRSFLLYDWNMKNLLDREYQLRAVSVCSDNSMYESEPLNGLADTKRPQLFGSPQPADGILSANDEIKIVFDEFVEEGLITDYNFEVEGVLNGSDLHHGTSVKLDGNDDYIRIPKGLSLKEKSFTIEYWLKKETGATGTIFSVGNNQNNTFRIYYDAGKVNIDVNGNTQSTENTFDDGSWHHWAVVYNEGSQMFTVYCDDQLLMEKELQSVTTEDWFYLGKDNTGDADFFTGNIHDLRIWNRALSYSKIVQRMSINLTSTEPGLVGFWPMDEAIGNQLIDESRSRHGILYGNWEVFPKSMGYQFNGSDQALGFSTSTIPMGTEMDMTFELWFKAGADAAGSCIFSNGNVDEEVTSAKSIWNINLTDEGKIEVRNNDVSVTSENAYHDGQWHHVAFVLNRRSYGSLYMDGEKVASVTSAGFGNFQSAYAYIGARGYVNNSGVKTFDKHFTGSVDEVRIWNLARKQEQIDMYMNTKLTPDETGLKAYFPYETYEEVMGVMQSASSMEDMSVDPYSDDGSSHCGSLMVEGSKSISENAPNIAREPAKQNVDFDFAVHENSIIITPNASLALIERCILEITAKGIKDKNDNAMASPVTWTAYVDKNEVRWDDELFEFEKELGEPLTFETRVVNLGGLQQDFTISNIPDWMTVEPVSASVAPNSEVKISFTVNSSMGIGNYQEDLYLESKSGFNEKLALNMRVFKPAPDWNVNPSEYESSMNIAAQLKIKDIFSSDQYDMIGVFAGDECRGVASLEYKESYDDYISYLVIYGTEAGEELSYKIWDASEGMIYADVSPVYSFEPNKFYGSMAEPVVFSAGGMVDNTIDLNKGWNWISLNLDMDNMEVDKLFSEIKLHQEDIIKHGSEFATYDLEGDAWYGSLKTVDLGKLYRVKMKQGGHVTYMGAPVNPENYPVDLVNGWNRIGYLPSKRLPVNEALAGFEPEINDIIKSQFQFATWDGYEWMGSLSYMKPGEGYMYQSQAVEYKSFVYPDVSEVQLKSATTGKQPVSLATGIDARNYEYSMNVVAQVINTDVPEGSLVGAYINGELRGIGELTQSDDMKNYSFITVFGESKEAHANLSFKLLGEESALDLNGKATFDVNKVTGTVGSPLLLSAGNGLSMDNNLALSEVAIYPNPFAEQLNIDVFLVETGKLEISLYNVVGEKLTTLFSGNVEAGEKTFKLNADKDKLKGMKEGMYLIKVITGSKTQVHKLYKTE